MPAVVHGQQPHRFEGDARRHWAHVGAHRVARLASRHLALIVVRDPHDTLEGGREVPLYVTRRYCCIRIVQHGTPPDTLARLASSILLLTMLKEHLELTLEYQVGVV